jgi:hypothetical protein
MLLAVGGALGFYLYKTAQYTVSPHTMSATDEQTPSHHVDTKRTMIAKSSTNGLSKLRTKHKPGSSVPYQWDMAGLHPGVRDKPRLAAY